MRLLGKLDENASRIFAIMPRLTYKGDHRKTDHRGGAAGGLCDPGVLARQALDDLGISAPIQVDQATGVFLAKLCRPLSLHIFKSFWAIHGAFCTATCWGSRGTRQNF